MTKKFLLLFAAALWLNMLSGFAQSGTCGDNLTWNFDSSTGVLTIGGTGAMTDYSTASAAPWHSYRANIKTVVIQNGVTSISSSEGSNYAFSNCSGLKKVVIEDGSTALSINFYAYSSMYGGVVNRCFLDSPCDTVYLGRNVSYANKVNHVGQWSPFQNKATIKELTVGESVTEIAATMFASCSGLKGNLNIPNSVISIGRSAFTNCTGITSITIGRSVQSIGSYAFTNCPDLTVVNFNAVNCTSAYTSGLYYEPLFEGCIGLTTVNIGNDVTTIPAQLFDACRYLTEITIPNSVTSIGSSAFNGCTGLTGTLIIPDRLTSIGSAAFSGCTGLTGVSIGNSVDTIGSQAFRNCSGFTGELIIPNAVRVIEDAAFSGCSGLTGTLTIPNNVNSIGSNAFSGCSKLTTINFNAVNCSDFYDYSNSPFYTCSSLNTINIGNNVIKIPAFFMYGRNSLTGILTIPNSVTYIGDAAFSGCGGLTGVTIGNSVDTISNRAFSSCSGLTEIIIPNSVNLISGSAFLNCIGLKKFVIEDGNTALAFNYSNSTSPYKNYVFENVPLDTVYMGRNISYNNTYIYGYSPFYSKTSLQHLTVGESVTSIESDLFSDCSGLTVLNFNAAACEDFSSYGTYFSHTSIDTISIGNKVARIPANFLKGIACTGAISIPGSVTSIGSSAFSGCTGLTAINVDAGNQNYTSIDGVLYNRAQTTLLQCPLGKTGAVSIPNTVTSVDERAFSSCSGLKKLVIENGNTALAFNYYSSTSYDNPFFYNVPLDTVYLGRNIRYNNTYNANTNYDLSPFYRKTTIRYLTVANAVTTIPDNAFYGCTQLDTVTVQWTSPLYISANVFSDVTCSNVTLKVPAGTAPAYRVAFVWQNFKIPVEESELPCSPSTNYGGIAETAIVWAICDSTLHISGSGSIPDYTAGGSPWFPYTSFIKDVEIGANISRIGNHAFYRCSKLTSVVIPATVNSMGSYVFAYCSALSSVTFQTLYLPDGEIGMTIGITGIGEYAFPGCTSLPSITLPETFRCVNCTGTAGNVPAFRGNSLSAIYVSPDNPYYTSEGGILFDKNKTVIIQYPAKKAGNTYFVPANVTKICAYAFDGNTNLASVVIPNNVTTIEKYSFDGCTGLESVTLPLNPIKNCTYYFGELFHTATQTLSNSTYDNYSQTGYKQTYHRYVSCTSCYNNGRGYIHYYYYVPASLKTVNITDEAAVPAGFFQNTGLETVSMSSVQNIGINAFSGCDLKKVTTSVVVSDISKSTLEELIVTSACTSITAGVLSTAVKLKELTLPFIGASSTATGENAVLGALFGTTTSSTSITQYYEDGNSKKYAIPQTLEKVTVARPATQIKYGAFYGCSFLKEVIVGSEVTGVGQKAFFDCNGLTDIYAHRAMPPSAYANNTFEGVNKFSCKLHVPANSAQYYSLPAAAGWNEFYTVEEEAPLAITALPLPSYGGQITGITAYNYEDEAAIEAHSNMGYDFQGWMEGETIVSTSSTYNFTVTAPRALYAVFVPLENENSVTCTPQLTEVSIEWDGEAGASSYSLVIYLDAARTQVYTTLHFDADGTPQQPAPQMRSVQSRMLHTVGGLQSGQSYYYSLTSYDADNYALSIAVGNFATLTASGIDEIESINIKIYPNPVKDEIFVKAELPVKRIEVYSLTGGLLLQENNFSGRISVSTLPKGIYLLRVHTDKGMATSKIIKE